jgi:uncharacterized protein
VRNGVLWDSSAILAAMNAEDADHASARAVVQRLGTERRPSFITNYLETESHALILRKAGRAAAREWLLAGQIPVLHASREEEERAKAILLRHADKDWSLCDAISFAVMESRGVSTAFSFDRHFKQYGRFTVLGLG